MKIDYKHVLVFGLIFMIFQYSLLITEITPYANMVKDIQMYKPNFYKNLDNNFTFKNIVIFTIFYALLVCFFYYYIIFPKRSFIEGFLFVSVVYGVADIGILFSLFDKAVKHIDVLLYDTFIVGGLCIVLSKYILYNYYTVLQDYIPLLFILYISSALWFLYESYKYNPDLSNVRGIVLF